MLTPQFIRYAGWVAVINLAAHVTSLLALALFFAFGGFWGPLNDALSVAWSLSLVPLAYLLLQINREVFETLDIVTAVVGIMCMLAFATLQSLLVTGAVRYEQTLGPVLTLSGAIGLWLLVNAMLAALGHSLPRGLVTSMLVYGLGLFVSAVGFWYGGQGHPATAAGYIVGSVAGILWAAWLAWILLTGRLTIPT
jgi:hypothetical protein